MRCWYAFGVAAPLAAPITPQTAQTVTVTRRRDLGLSSRRTSAGPYHRAAETGVFVMLASMKLCALFGLYTVCARPGRLLPSRACDVPRGRGSAKSLAPNGDSVISSRIRHIPAIACVVALALGTASAATADPGPVASKQAEAQSIIAQINTI